MPRTEYTFARRVAMQIALWGVLAGSVGVAALVDRQLAAPPVTLAEQHDHPPLHFRLPAGWDTVYSSDDDPHIIAIAAEPSVALRTLVIYLQRFNIQLSPEECLQHSGLAADIFASSQPEQITMLNVGGVPAVRLLGHAAVLTPQGEVLESEMVVCLSYPNRRAATVLLSKRGTWTDADFKLMNGVVGALKMDGVASLN